MNVALRKKMTLGAFLEWEARQEFKWEFDGWGPVAMAGGTDAHATIQANVIGLLWAHLRGRSCRVLGPDMKVRAAESIRYPDALVTCAPSNASATIVQEPVIVFEVLSPSTQETDRGEKNREYAATPSIQRYVLLEQAEEAATVFHRAGGAWVGLPVAQGGTIDLPEIGLSVPLAEFYAGVVFPAAGETAA